MLAEKIKTPLQSPPCSRPEMAIEQDLKREVPLMPQGQIPLNEKL